MSYYWTKKRELSELLRLVRKEKEHYLNIAKIEKDSLDEKIEILKGLGIFDDPESPYNKLIEAKKNIAAEKKRIEREREYFENKMETELVEFKSKKKVAIDSYRQEIEQQLELKRMEIIDFVKSQTIEDEVIQLEKEKASGFPWLAQAYDEYNDLKDLRLANWLEEKSPPAPKAAETVRQIAKERREAEKAARLADYLLQYCRFLAPWLDEYIGMEAEELDTIIHEIHESWQKKEQEFDEEVKRQIGPKKYESLSPSEKLQRKLDWYWNKPNKSNWQIGRDYERFIGYLYERDGWSVYFHGKKGFEDLGRDLICKKSDNIVDIVQCKYWAKEKIIHEKHVYYLFGTTVEYYLDNFEIRDDVLLPLFPDLIQEKKVTPKLIITIDVSPKAAQVAKVLKVSVEKIPFERYPSVKCNVSRKNEEKIYHLPFDQQYDSTLIEDERLECYVNTIAEAEALGFRHAYRWTGSVET